MKRESFEAREWYCAFANAAVRDARGLEQGRVQLFAPKALPEPYVLQQIKVDTEIPHEALQSMWLVFAFEGGNTYEFPCTAFNRLQLEYYDVADEDACDPEDQQIDPSKPHEVKQAVRWVAPRLSIPLYIQEGHRVSVYLKGTHRVEIPFDKRSMTVTLIGVACRLLATEKHP